eukprot:366041-Chlamydomonas_euryale.AAC.2
MTAHTQDTYSAHSAHTSQSHTQVIHSGHTSRSHTQVTHPGTLRRISPEARQRKRHACTHRLPTHRSHIRAHFDAEALRRASTKGMPAYIACPHTEWKPMH